MGQGIHTKLAQIAAEILGAPVECVRVMPTATDKVPNTSPTSASLSMDLNGPAVRNAAEEIVKRLECVRERNPKLSWRQLVQKAYESKISLSATGYHS